MNSKIYNVYGKNIRVVNNRIGEYVFRECAEGKWKPGLFATFDRFLKPTDTYVDIGAYAGASTLYPAMMGCRVFAFECDPEAFWVLTQNVYLNRQAAKNIVLSARCIAHRNGMLDFAARSNFGDSTSGLMFTGLGGQQDTVHAITLARAVVVYQIGWIDFIKVNVQGAEGLLLESVIDDVLVQQAPTLHIYIRPANWIDKEKEARRLIPALEVYKHVYTEQGVAVAPEKILTSEWMSRPDYKLIATDKDWE